MVRREKGRSSKAEGDKEYWWTLGITIVLIAFCRYFAQHSLKKREM